MYSLSSGETLVIALGGNALLKRRERGMFEEQFANVILASKEIVGLIEKDFRVVLTHGNGPQVGATLIRHDLAKNVVPALPLHACNAETQGFIGYMIQQALQNELNRRSITKSVVSVVTRVLVDRNDPSFQNPTKPIGPYFEKSQYPNLLNIFEGYKQGAKYINPVIKVIETYLGDWDSPEKGRQAALIQIFSGADFILHVADTSGKGVIEAAKERGIYAFGAVSDQHHIAPEAVLTSFVLDIDKAFDQIVKTVVENRFEGKIYKPGLEVSKGAPGEGIVYLAPFYNLEGRVPEDVKQRLNQLTQDIINGTIVVPEKYEVTTDFSQKSALTATNTTIAKTEPKKILKIALVTDGLFNDGAWGTAAYNAAKQLETSYGHNVTCIDNIAISDIETTLRQYSQDGYNLIIAHGFEWGDAAVRVGAEFPNTKYVVFTGLVNSTNVASIFPMQQEGSFLLGALAAMMTQTGTIGYVGGDRYPNIINIFEGFEQGARHINPNINIIGTYIGEFDNPATGKEAGLAQINSGADFLFHVADTSGHGVIEAARERGVLAFGAVSDQNALAPEAVLTSFVLDIDKAFDQIVKTVVENRFEGKIYKPGLEVSKGAPGEGIVYLAPFYNLEGRVPEDVKQRLNQLTQDIINGTIVVPEKFEE